MNIFHVFPIWSISSGGGTTWLIYELAKYQTKENNVTILTGSYCFDNDLKIEAEKLGIKVKVYKSYFNKLGLYLMPGLLFENKIFKTKTIFHFHLFRSFQNLVILLKIRNKKTPCIVDAHGSIPTHNIKPLKKIVFDFFFKKFIVRNTKFFIAENNLSHKECESIGVPKEKIKIINPPFPIHEFEDVKNLNVLKRKFNIQSKHIVLYFGRLHYIKGIDILIKGFEALSKKRDDIHLVIMGGDDGYRSNLIKLTNELKIANRITFTGFIMGKEKLSVIKEATVCVQTSRYEQGAGTPFESVLIGTPIIVSDNSGAAEDVMRADGGYLTKFDDTEDLANRLNYVIENLNEAKRKTSKAAKKIKTNQSFLNTLVKYQKIYELSIETKSSH